MTTTADAAQAVLDAHDASERARERRPEIDDAIGLPRDRAAYIAWYQAEALPARRALRDALNALEQAMGTEFPGSRPWLFRPVCERILGIDKSP